MTLIVGSEGSMGKRYQAILKSLGEDFHCHDIKLPNSGFDARIFDRFIIASPTHTHLEWVRKLNPFNKPILCEKPLSHSMEEVREILRSRASVTTMMQYSVLVDDKTEGPSHYNYFRSGPDGIIWDCFQIIGLAKGEISLRNDSPVWDCAINGQQLSISQMDRSYIAFVQMWIAGMIKQDRQTILDMHTKTEKMAGEFEANRSPHRNPGPLWFNTLPEKDL